jgi:hypothetical protein
VAGGAPVRDGSRARSGSSPSAAQPQVLTPLLGSRKVGGRAAAQPPLRRGGEGNPWVTLTALANPHPTRNHGASSRLSPTYPFGGASAHSRGL